MILAPLLRLRSQIFAVSQVRNIRAHIVISKDRYRLRIDMHYYCKEDLLVKARPGFLSVEGYNESKTKSGFVTRRLSRKFKLPSGCNIDRAESTLSSDGILTICVPRHITPRSDSCETLVTVKSETKPVTAEESMNTQEPMKSLEPKKSAESKKPPEPKKPPEAGQNKPSKG